MSALRVRFIWSPKDKRGKFENMGALRFTQEISGPQTYYVVGIDMRAFIRGGIVAAVILWLGGVWGLSLWLDRNPYNRIGAVDLLLPWRWSSLRELRGQAHLAQGREDLKAGRYADGVFRIKAGLRQYPHDHVARLDLGRLYAQVGQWEPVKQVMLPGAEGSELPPRAYLKFFFEQAERFEDFDTVASVSDRFLAQPGVSPTDRNWLTERKVDSLYRARRFDEVLTFSAQPDIAHLWRVQDARIAALVQLHRPAEAIAYIESVTWATARQSNRLQMLALAYREAGRVDDMNATLEQLVRDYPGAAENWLFAIGQWWAADRKADAERTLRGFRLRFESNDPIWQLAAFRFASLPAPRLVEICVESARSRGRPLLEFQWQLTLAYLRSGEFAAFERAGRIVAQLGQSGAATEWIDAMSVAVRSDTAEAADRLMFWSRERPRTSQMYRDTLVGLEKAGKWSAAESVATAARVSFPASADLRERRDMAAKKAAEQAEAAAKAAPAPVVARTPVAPKNVVVAPVAQRPEAAPSTPPIASADQLWRELDAAMAERDWGKASRVIDGVRRVEPAWFSSVAAELDWREARVFVERGDALRVRRLVTERLDRDKLAVNRALELAREYRERGNLAEARRLTETILSRVPESGLARRLQAELAAPAASDAP